MRREIVLGFCLCALSVMIAVPAQAGGMYPDSIILIDEDCIDNGAKAIEEIAASCLCSSGGCDPAVCVNDHIADPGVRVPLELTMGTIIGNAFYPDAGTEEPLMSGQLFDEAFFMLSEAPESWVDAGPTANGLWNYLLAVAPGFGFNGEFLLDEIPGVTPLRTAELEAMVGETFCAVVYDSDISMNYNPLQGNLMGATCGLLAFTLLDVGEPDDEVLPDITIRIENPNRCQGDPTASQPISWGVIKALYQ